MLESYFKPFRANIIGIDKTINTPFGSQKLLYADWTASGRTYAKIEDKFRQEIFPLIANTHTETTTTGKSMTNAYHMAKNIVKTHVNADQDDVLIFTGSGMTGAINKFQRILGLKYPEQPERHVSNISHHDKGHPDIPIVFVTHMEHHSNQTSWLETIAKVEVIRHTKDGLVDLNDLKTRLAANSQKKLKIAAVTACSNVTGIKTPYKAIAEIMHQAQGYCFVDFACSGPYVDIDMHPENEGQKLDAVFLSPHKFLGGPGTSGVVVFSKDLYHNQIPDHPGGGTVVFTNPWEVRAYISDIETREDGGTPPFLQSMKTAMAVKLKEQMQTQKILDREQELNAMIFDGFDQIPEIHILANQHRNRLSVFSFTVKDIHYNLVVKLLNDKYGIQTRGGCACAGTYGHYLLDLDPNQSKSILKALSEGDQTVRPGWIRLSLHPTTTNTEVDFIIDAIRNIISNIDELKTDYQYNNDTNEFDYIGLNQFKKIEFENWFE